MTDTTTAQAATPDPQAGDGQPEQEQPKIEQLTPEQLRAQLTQANSEAAATRKKLREAEARIAAADKAKSDAEAAALADQGKYKELYDQAAPKLAEYDALKAAHDALIEQVRAANEKRIAAIPEGMRSLVPEYDDPQRLAAWLEANSAVFAKSPAPNLDGRAGGNGNGAAAVSDEEVRDFAVRMGVPFDYVDRAALAKMRQR